MNSYWKTCILLAVAACLFASEAAIAAPTYLDSSAKARGDYGRGSSGSSMRSRSYRAYRPAPMIARSESAPSEVAQAPVAERRFSYEPSSQVETSGDCCCGSSVRSEQAPETAQRSTESRRSFSYEPSTESGTAQPSVRSYSVPRMRSPRSSRQRGYMLQKTDPNKYHAF